MKFDLANLFAATVAPWVSESFPIIRMVLLIIIAVISFALIFVVLFQPGKEAGGMGARGGSTTDTFYSKNKSQTWESTLKRLTIVLSVVIAVLAIAFFVTVAIYSGM